MWLFYIRTLSSCIAERVKSLRNTVSVLLCLTVKQVHFVSENIAAVDFGALTEDVCLDRFPGQSLELTQQSTALRFVNCNSLKLLTLLPRSFLEFDFDKT